MLVFNILSLFFQIMEITQVYNMYKEVLHEVQAEQSMMHEIDIHNKISKEIKDSLERGLKRSANYMVRSRLKLMIKRIQS
jgi:glutathionylspermidine synthase